MTVRSALPSTRRKAPVDEPLRLAVVSAFPPGPGSLNEYGDRVVRALAAQDEVSEVHVLADADSLSSPGCLADVAERHRNRPELTLTEYVTEGSSRVCSCLRRALLFRTMQPQVVLASFGNAISDGRAAVLPRIGDLIDSMEEEGFAGVYLTPYDPRRLADALEEVLPGPREADRARPPSVRRIRIRLHPDGRGRSLVSAPRPPRPGRRPVTTTSPNLPGAPDTAGPDTGPAGTVPAELAVTTVEAVALLIWPRDLNQLITVRLIVVALSPAPRHREPPHIPIGTPPRKELRRVNASYLACLRWACKTLTVHPRISMGVPAYAEEIRLDDLRHRYVGDPVHRARAVGSPPVASAAAPAQTPASVVS